MLKNIKKKFFILTASDFETIKKYFKSDFKKLETKKILSALNLGSGQTFACTICGYIYVITECGGATQSFRCPGVIDGVNCTNVLGGSSH